MHEKKLNYLTGLNILEETLLSYRVAIPILNIEFQSKVYESALLLLNRPQWPQFLALIFYMANRSLGGICIAFDFFPGGQSEKHGIDLLYALSI